jgi:hypothetical protein
MTFFLSHLHGAVPSNARVRKSIMEPGQKLRANEYHQAPQEGDPE